MAIAPRYTNRVVACDVVPTGALATALYMEEGGGALAVVPLTSMRVGTTSSDTSSSRRICWMRGVSFGTNRGSQPSHLQPTCFPVNSSTHTAHRHL